MPKKKPDIKSSTVQGIFAGVITVHNLPQDVYYMNAQKLMSGVHKGWKGSVQLAYNSPNWKLYESISDNIFLFSGAKTFKQTLDMSEALLDEDGKLVPFDKFKEVAGEIFSTFNEDYLESEYYTALDGAREADKWLDYKKNGVEYLRFLTSNDETVCEICGGYDDTVLPITDSFWDVNYPPLHFRCNCTTQPEYDAEEETERPEQSDVSPGFRNNIAKTGVIFNKHNGYFQIPAKYKDLARNNFGLPLPAHTLSK